MSDNTLPMVPGPRPGEYLVKDDLNMYEGTVIVLDALDMRKALLNQAAPKLFKDWTDTINNFTYTMDHFDITISEHFLTP
jgi:hypothetical protein